MPPLELVIGLKITDVVIAKTLKPIGCQGGILSIGAVNLWVYRPTRPWHATVMIQCADASNPLVSVAIKASTVRAAAARLSENSNLVAHS